MKKYVAGMVIYPPERKFSEERKIITYYTVSEERAPAECFKLKYWHHNWVSDFPIEVGSRCFCGKEVAIEGSNRLSLPDMG